MSIGLFIIILTAIFLLYTLINRILDLVEYKVKNPSRVEKNKNLYKTLENEDIDNNESTK